MRKGSLVLNPGGPGGSGVDFALGVGPFIGQLYGEDVRRSFDIVGVDPRGIGRSTPLRCFGNLQQAAAAFPPVPFPMTSGEEAAVVRADGVLAGQCDRQGNVVGRHMSTAGVARDLDVLRQRLGEQRLNFLGLSYGSYLGTTYANLFPDRVGSVVVDAVLDPVAWRNRGGQAPSTSLLGSHLGAQATLEKFFELCDSAGSGCALAPASADRFARLAARLEAAPGLFVDPVTGEQFLSATRTSSLSRSAACTTSSPSLSLAQVLALLEGSASPEAVGAAFARLDAANGLVTKRGLPRYLNVLEGFPGVLCSDSENPRSYAAWSAAGVQADQGQLLRSPVDLGVEPVRAVADDGPRSLRRSVHRPHRVTSARRGQPLRPCDALRRCPGSPPAAAELVSADGRRGRPHLARGQRLRRGRHRAVPARSGVRGPGRRWHDVPGRVQPVRAVREHVGTSRPGPTAEAPHAGAPPGRPPPGSLTCSHGSHGGRTLNRRQQPVHRMGRCRGELLP
jgi:pimeloyl-ACP methyl ester carboxylesterase